jgi:hypothetical protein
VAARRDTALLPMGFAGAFRRPELTGLTVADVTLHRTDELHVRLRTSKTDQESTTAGSDRYWNTTSPPACIAGSGPPPSNFDKQLDPLDADQAQEIVRGRRSSAGRRCGWLRPPRPWPRRLIR